MKRRFVSWSICILSRLSGWFGNSSRIIATTRDKRLIGKNVVVYEVTILRLKNAMYVAMDFFIRVQM